MLAPILDFLKVGTESDDTRRLLAETIVPQLGEVVDRFYIRLRASPLGRHLGDDILPHLKRSQIRHWTTLFTSSFEQAFDDDARRIALRHREIGLSPAWYVAAYSSIKIDFLDVVARSNFGPATKGRLMRALERYIAADMTFALAAYDLVLLD